MSFVMAELAIVAATIRPDARLANVGKWKVLG